MPLDYKSYGIKTAAGRMTYDAAMRQADKLQVLLKNAKSRKEEDGMIRRIHETTENGIRRALSFNPPKKRGVAGMKPKWGRR